MEGIVEHLEGEIPHGEWCDGCCYLRYSGYVCDLMEEVVFGMKKVCGVNEEDA